MTLALFASEASPIETSPAGLQDLGDSIRLRMDARHAAREEAIAPCRTEIRHSANAIRALHRSEFRQAEELLSAAEQLLDKAQEALSAHPDIFHAGFVHDAQKEYAEAWLTLALVTGRPLPSPQHLRVGDAAYLNGMGEAVGELRRYLLDNLRQGKIARCEAILVTMDDIYNLLTTMDYPDAITGGLRRTTDNVRGILERTRGDFTSAALQDRLAERLSAVRDHLDRQNL